MSLDRIVLGPDPELLAEARAAWPTRQRSQRGDNSGKWSSIGTELKPLLGFFEILRKIGERARERGDVGEGGGYVWSIAEWQRFVRAVDENPHAKLYGTAAFKTAANVQMMIADGKTAREIHAALYWRSRKDDSEEEQRVATERAHAERTAAASFETAVQEKLKDERARAEARRRARDESDDKSTRRRVAV